MTDLYSQNRWAFWATTWLLIAAAAGGPARAQLVPRADPSPLAPGDLKRPIFDTRTPVYDDQHQQEKSAGAVVAEVDGRVVTLGDVANAIAELPPDVGALPFETLFPGVLDRLIGQQALVIRAQQQALDEDPAVRRRLKAAADKVMANELLHREISRGITEQALLDRYAKEIAGKPGPEQVHARVIMVPTEQAATGMITELRGGADFAVLAKRSSLDPTASTGGDLGYVRLDGLTAEVGAVAFSLAPGQFTAFPVRSGDGWFVVKVEDRRQQPTPSFPEVRQELVGEMLREGVADVVTRVLAHATVRKYSISGKEITGAESAQ